MSGSLNGFREEADCGRDCGCDWDWDGGEDEL